MSCRAVKAAMAAFGGSLSLDIGLGFSVYLVTFEAEASLLICFANKLVMVECF